MCFMRSTHDFIPKPTFDAECVVPCNAFLLVRVSLLLVR